MEEIDKKEFIRMSSEIELSKAREKVPYRISLGQTLLDNEELGQKWANFVNESTEGIGHGLLLDETLDLVEENFEEKEYRLLGCGLSNLVSPENLPKEYNLFTILSEKEKLNNIDNLMEELQSKYGKKALFWNKTSK